MNLLVNTEVIYAPFCIKIRMFVKYVCIFCIIQNHYVMSLKTLFLYYGNHQNREQA
jgi:hypothetical protein